MDIKKIGAEELKEIINKRLIEDEEISLIQIYKELNLKGSSVRSKLKREGYKFNQDKRLYCKELTQTIKPLTETEIKAIRKLLEQVQDKDSPRTELEINLRYSDDEVVAKNIKLSKELNERFIALFKTLHPNRLLDLYNTIFEEFLNKYE